MKGKKWSSPYEWLAEKIEVLAAEGDVHLLKFIARELCISTESPVIEEKFKALMKVDGYYDEPTFKVGDRFFKYENGETYMLAVVGSGEVLAINAETGYPWNSRRRITCSPGVFNEIAWEQVVEMGMNPRFHVKEEKK